MTNDGLAKVAEFLDKMGIPYTKDKLGGEDKPPVLLTAYRTRGKEFLVVVMADEKWIRIKARVLNLSEAEDLKKDSELIMKIYHLALVGNFYLDEVTFSADKDGNLYVEADMLSTVSFDTFKEEFNSLAVGIDYFLDAILPQE